MGLPKISIVTPSFNQGEFLESTINSVISQEYPNLEYIIIDGGSTDGSIEIIKKYERFINFWVSEPDAGQYDAINKGFSHSTGEILAWLNSDDLYFPWTFRTVSSIISKLPEIEWLTTLCPAYWDWQGFCVDIGQDILGYSKEAFLDGCYFPNSVKKRKDLFGLYNCIQQESTFWKRTLWEKTGGYVSDDFKLAADFDLWSRFYQYADLYGTTSPLAGFRFQAKQRSTQIDFYVAEAEKSLSIMREAAGWSAHNLRYLAIRLKLNQIPKIRNYIFKKCFYLGKKVIRQKPNQPDGFWCIKEHKFFKNF
jgi:glycosyltransferase involved in cell wall biosynthesis